MEDFIQLFGGFLLGVVTTLISTWAGYRLKASDERTAKKLRVHASWGAISAEVEACKRMATEYLTPKDGPRVAAPQWRLPDVMLTRSLRALLGDGDPTETEVDALLKFHTEVDSLNRGLDIAQASDRMVAFARMEVNDLKAARLIEGGGCYDVLRPLIDRHVPRS